MITTTYTQPGNLQITAVTFNAMEPPKRFPISVDPADLYLKGGVDQLDGVFDTMIDELISMYEELDSEPGLPSYHALMRLKEEKLARIIADFTDRHDCGRMETWDEHWQTLFRIEHPGMLP